MRRLLVMGLVGFGLAVSTAPAHAEVRVGIHAAQTTVMAGTSTTISGAVSGATPGSLVKLQRRVGGTWTTVREKRIRVPRRYSFTVRPPRGLQLYRVVKPRQLGQARAVSPAIQIRVQWNPTLAVTAEALNDPAHGQGLRVTGRVEDGPPSPTLGLERMDADGWVTVEQRPVDAAGAFGFNVFADPGLEYRVRLLATTFTTEQTSQSLFHSYTPYVMELNSLIYLEDLPATSGRSAAVEVEVTAGDYVTLSARRSGTLEFVGSVTSPSGQPVATFHAYPDNLVRLSALETGTYLIEISQTSDVDHWVSLAVSTPKVVTTSIDAEPVASESDLDGQPIDIRFDTTGTSDFTVPNAASTGETLSVLDSSGSVVQPWIPGVVRDREPVYRSIGGIYTFRMESRDRVLASRWARPLSVARIAATVDGPTVEAIIDEPHRVVLVDFERPVEKVTVGYPFERSGARIPTVGVFDAVAGEPDPTGPGHSVVAVSAFDDAVLSLPIQLTTPLHVDVGVDGQPVDVDLAAAYKREVALHFHAEEGQYAILSHSAETGSWIPATALAHEGGSLTKFRAFSKSVWRIPADGEYTAISTAANGLVGSVSLSTAETILLPGDGTPATVNLDEPGEIIVATVPMPVGSIMDATLDNVTGGFADPDGGRGTWDITLLTPDNSYWYNSWAKPGLLPPEVVREPGIILALITADGVGTARLTFTPRV